MCYNNSCKEILQGGENMKITRELTVNKINVICYDPENKCEITKEMILIGNLTDDQIRKEIKKRNLGIVSKAFFGNRIFRITVSIHIFPHGFQLG